MDPVLQMLFQLKTTYLQDPIIFQIKKNKIKVFLYLRDARILNNCENFLQLILVEFFAFFFPYQGLNPEALNH